MILIKNKYRLTISSIIPILLLLIYKFFLDYSVFTENFKEAITDPIPQPILIQKNTVPNQAIVKKKNNSSHQHKDSDILESKKIFEEAPIDIKELYSPHLEPTIKLLADTGVYIDKSHIFNGPNYQDWGSLNIFRLIISYLLVVLSWFLIKDNLTSDFKVSRFLLFFQYIFIIVPLISLSVQDKRSILFLFYVLITFFLVCFLVRKFNSLRIPRLNKVISKILIFFLLTVVFYFFFNLVKYTPQIITNFEKVYDFRAMEIQRTFYLKDFLITNVGFTLLIFFLTLSIKFKRWFFAMFFIMMQFSMFFFTGHKSFLFLTFVSVGYLVIRQFLSFKITFFTGLFTFIALLLILIYLGVDIGYGILNRIFITPAALSTLYYEFFSTHDLALGSGTRFSYFFKSPYNIDVVDLVAHYYWGYDFSPNVFWIANAYSNYGLLGMLLFAVMVSVYLIVADSYSKYLKDDGFSEIIFLGTSLAFISTGFTTLIFTGGGGFAFLCLILFTSLVPNSISTKSKNSGLIETT